MLSSYPKLYDQFFEVSEISVGVSVTEERLIPDNCIIDLRNYAKEGSIVISGFTEVLSEDLIENKTFWVEDYNTPPEVLAFKVGRRLHFHPNQTGGKYSITYLNCGTNITDARINQLQDAVMQIEKTIGICDRKIFGFIRDIYLLLRDHNHDGIKTKKLNHQAVTNEILVDANFDDNAQISRSKIAYV